LVAQLKLQLAHRVINYLISYNYSSIYPLLLNAETEWSLTAVCWFIRPVTTVILAITEVECRSEAEITSFTFEQVIISTFYIVKTLTVSAENEGARAHSI